MARNAEKAKQNNFPKNLRSFLFTAERFLFHLLLLCDAFTLSSDVSKLSPGEYSFQHVVYLWWGKRFSRISLLLFLLLLLLSLIFCFYWGSVWSGLKGKLMVKRRKKPQEALLFFYIMLQNQKTWDAIFMQLPDFRQKFICVLQTMEKEQLKPKTESSSRESRGNL